MLSEQITVAARFLFTRANLSRVKTNEVKGEITMKARHVLSGKRLVAVFACLVLCTGLFSLPSVLAVPPATPTLDAAPPATATPNPNEIRLTDGHSWEVAETGAYYRVRTTTLDDGTSIDEIVINGPPTPPPGYKRPVAKIPDKGVKL